MEPKWEFCFFFLKKTEKWYSKIMRTGDRRWDSVSSVPLRVLIKDASKHIAKMITTKQPYYWLYKEKDVYIYRDKAHRCKRVFSVQTSFDSFISKYAQCWHILRVWRLQHLLSGPKIYKQTVIRLNVVILYVEKVTEYCRSVFTRKIATKCRTFTWGSFWLCAPSNSISAFA